MHQIPVDETREIQQPHPGVAHSSYGVAYAPKHRGVRASGPRRAGVAPWRRPSRLVFIGKSKLSNEAQASSQFALAKHDEEARATPGHRRRVRSTRRRLVERSRCGRRRRRPPSARPRRRSPPPPARAPRPPSRRRLWRAAFLVVGDAVLAQHETYVLEKLEPGDDELSATGTRGRRSKSSRTKYYTSRSRTGRHSSVRIPGFVAPVRPASRV